MKFQNVSTCPITDKVFGKVLVDMMNKNIDDNPLIKAYYADDDDYGDDYNNGYPTVDDNNNYYNDYADDSLFLKDKDKSYQSESKKSSHSQALTSFNMVAVTFTVLFVISILLVSLYGFITSRLRVAARYTAIVDVSNNHTLDSSYHHSISTSVADTNETIDSHGYLL